MHSAELLTQHTNFRLSCINRFFSPFSIHSQYRPSPLISSLFSSLFSSFLLLMSFSKSFFFAFLLPVFLSLLCGYFLHFHTTPVFDQSVLRSIAEEARVAFPPDGSLRTLNSTVELIVSRLHRAYPRHIHPGSGHIWVTNLAGGFKTSMLILHASLTEYVMIWGAQLHTTGHSGRNAAEFNDYVISGEGRWWKEGGLEVTVAGPMSPSNHVYTEYFSGGIVELTSGTFMLEHCHGVIPALLPFGLGDAIFSSMDVVTIYRSMKAYATLTIKEILENGKI